MTAFAVTTVDWSSQRRSYLDNFINYALSVIPPDATTAFPRDSIRPRIIEEFNLILPAAIVNQLVRRAIKLGFLSPVGEFAVTLTEKGRREVAPIPYTLKKLASEQTKVSQRLVVWARNELHLEIEPARATNIILDYVETYYCSLMALSQPGSGTRFRLPKVEPSLEQRVAAAFITSLSESGDELFESIADMARGTMMVSALYAPGLVDTTRGFRNTTIYLDTKIVFRALGYEGEAAQQATSDLLSILARQHARLAVFEFTLREIQSVLEAVAHRARGGRMWGSRPGSVEAYFYRMNASNSQIEQHSIRVEGRMSQLGIHVDANPPYENHRFVVDEASIEETLRRGNPNYRPSALKHDVELIAAMVRSRAGRARGSLEESRATFMTLNSLVVTTARLAEREYKEPWPLVMFENDVAALTWVKEPLAAPNLPRHQLLATSLGLTNPGKHDWDLVIAEIGRLADSDEITDNDVILLRQRYEQQSLDFIASYASAGDTDRRVAARASVADARDAIKRELEAPIQARNEQLSVELADSHLEAAALRDQSEALSNRSAAQSAETDRLLTLHLNQAWRRAALIKWSIRAALLVVVCGAIAVTFIPDAEAWLEELPAGDVLVWVVRAIAVLAAVLGGFWGPIAELTNSVRKRYLIKCLQRLGVEPGRAETLGYSIL